MVNFDLLPNALVLCYKLYIAGVQGMVLSCGLHARLNTHWQFGLAVYNSQLMLDQCLSLICAGLYENPDLSPVDTLDGQSSQQTMLFEV